MGFLGNFKGAMGGAVNTGPSKGASFMSKLGGQMPGMVNGLAGKFGDPSMTGAVKGAGSVLGMRRPSMPQMPRVQNGMPGQMPGMQMPLPQAPGIDTGPSMPPPMMPQNQGIMGNIFNRPAGYERPMGPMQGTEIGGLFGKYNQMQQRNSGMRF